MVMAKKKVKIDHFIFFLHIFLHMLLCCILLLLVDLSQVMWSPSRHLKSFPAANWVSFDFNVSYPSC